MMDKSELQAIVSGELSKAANFNNDSMKSDRLKTLKYYHGEPFGKERKGYSKVVATEVRDTIEFMMPSVMNVFAKSGEFCRFRPRGPEDVPAAEAATHLVNFVINNDNEGFVVTHNWFKDALMFNIGVVKASFDEREEAIEDLFEGISQEEFQILEADPSVEIVAVMAPPDNLIDVSLLDVRIKRTTSSGKIKLENIPPEEFLFPEGARSLDDCRFVAHRREMTVSDLVAMGYDRKEIEQKMSLEGQDEEDQARHLDYDAADEAEDPSQRKITVSEVYIKIDYDDDGISELRRILAIGDGSHILENDPWDVIPFAVQSPILMPHRLVGLSVAELLWDLQEIKSTVIRQMMDNFYLVNNNRYAVVQNRVRLDDLLNSKPGGIVRQDAPGMVTPLPTQPLGPQAFQVLEYMDQMRDQRTGFSKASMGLDPDALQSTTASAVNATITQAQSKVEMIVRVFAETGCKQLAKLVLHLAKKHMPYERQIRIGNQFVPIDPGEWHNEFDLDVTVGLGTGREDEKMSALQMISQAQQSIIAALGPQNPVTGWSQYAATMRNMVEIAGIKDVDRYFSPPEAIDQAFAQQAEQAAQQGPPPDPALEMKQMELAQEAQIKQAQMAQEREIKIREQDMNMLLKREELQLEKQMSLEAYARGERLDTNLRRQQL